MQSFRVGIIGCGYIADYYARTLANHDRLIAAAVCDVRAERASAIGNFLCVPAFNSLESFLNKGDVDIVVNLTPHEFHSEITELCLKAGKHVYSEKPFAESVDRGRKLISLAAARDLGLASAPCTVLGEHAQTLWREIRRGSIGKPYLVYAEMDDGAVHQMAYEYWTNSHGVPWPAQSEFTAGCVMEHAAYPLSWLVMLFGPAKSVTAFSSTLIEDKGLSIDSSIMPQDFVVAGITFDHGVAARVTCGVVAERDRRFRVFGEEGVLTINDCWHFGSPVWLARRSQRATSRAGSGVYLHPPEMVPAAKGPRFDHHCGDDNDVDYSRGISELAASILERRYCKLDARMALHILEIQQAMVSSGNSAAVNLQSTFPKPQHEDWCD